MVQLLDIKGLSVMICAYTAEEGGDTRLLGGNKDICATFEDWVGGPLI